MAEVSYLNLHDVCDDDGGTTNDVALDLDSPPDFCPDFDDFDVCASDLEFLPSDNISFHSPIFTVQRRPGTPPPSDAVSDRGSIPATTADLFDHECQMNFVIDLLHERVEQSQSRSVTGFDSLHQNPNIDPNFGVVFSNGELGLTHLQLDLGLGFCADAQSNNDDENNSGFVVADDGSEFFVSRRAEISQSSESSTIICGQGEHLMGGLRVVDIGSESDSDENGVIGIEVHENDDYDLDNGNEGGAINDDDPNIGLCWDSFQLEDDHREWNDGFEWEEVDGPVDEREALSMFDVSVSAGEEARADVLRNLEWEVLLNVHNLDVSPEFVHDGEFNLGDHDGYNNTMEYEMLFGQFAENENALFGRPPAAKSVVKNLPSVVLKQKDVNDMNALCAVCKDEMCVAETVKLLPCAHRFHGDCIFPWLGIRNTCPVCRYELPTDDPDYERRRTQRAASRIR